MKDKTQKTTET